MRSFLRDFDLVAPRTLDDALTTLAREPDVWRPFAGGTDLMVVLEAGKLPPGRYLSLSRLRELRGIHVDDQSIAIGAMTTYAEVMAAPVLRAECPSLCAAAAETGGVATQNRGTVGGNIANASPAADTPPALLVHDAELELVSLRGVRLVPYDRFHLGYKRMDLAPDELIRSIRLPRGRAGWIHTWRKVGTRRAQAISKVCFAAALDLSAAARSAQAEHTVRDVRIAVGSVAPTVIRAAGAEASLRGRTLNRSSIAACCEALRGEIAPIDDLRSTAAYRSQVVVNLLEQFLASANAVTN
jgi:CO/xanthine dehydrogenase FAD-binding subunit